ncbi:MAG TPA: NADH-quinone oxidoreductase subunit L [Dehalococcoidia bacterium]|jgi:NADH-quinone oxidoreductase subunit J|nr:NADH-quinone oxidoreductase subunit L [Dehalococcoidia bacterium]
MLFQDVIFWILGVVAIGAALGVVLIRDLFRAALLLVLVFVSVAGFYVMLNAEFLAVVQVLIYVGAISILIIFAVMLTRDVQQGNLPNRLQLPAVLFAALLLSALVVVTIDTDWDLIPDDVQEKVSLVQTSAVAIIDTEDLESSGFTEEEQSAAKEAGLADLLIGDFVLPFEAVSVLLLAALIGALVLMRPRPPESSE